MVQLFYTTYISVDLAHNEIFRAKVGKGDIIFVKRRIERLFIFLNRVHRILIKINTVYRYILKIYHRSLKFDP